MTQAHHFCVIDFHQLLAQIEHSTSQTLCQVGERSGSSLDDLTKWEMAVVAKSHPSEIKNVKRMWLLFQIQRKNKKEVN